jgi:hypothetical protein
LPLRPPVALALRAIISPSSQDSTPLIDMEILQQLQEMDDDDDEREFSRSIVDEFREQVPEQLAIMKNHLSVALASPFLSPTHRWLQLGLLTRADPPRYLLALCSDDKDYLQVSQVAHFLKGSSAALGVAKVAALFELMQVKAKDIFTAVECALL